MSAVNIPLLRKAVEWAEAEAAKPVEQCQWYQGYWAVPAEIIKRDCGTCYCIAGRVLHDAGLPIDDYSAENNARAAAGLLGIDWEEAMYGGLFSASNDIQAVRRKAEEIAAAAGESLA
jgi:hypothetical protein